MAAKQTFGRVENVDSLNLSPFSFKLIGYTDDDGLSRRRRHDLKVYEVCSGACRFLAFTWSKRLSSLQRRHCCGRRRPRVFPGCVMQSA